MERSIVFVFETEVDLMPHNVASDGFNRYFLSRDINLLIKGFEDQGAFDTLYTNIPYLLIFHFSKDILNITNVGQEEIDLCGFVKKRLHLTVERSHTNFCRNSF